MLAVAYLLFDVIILNILNNSYLNNLLYKLKMEQIHCSIFL